MAAGIVGNVTKREGGFCFVEGELEALLLFAGFAGCLPKRFSFYRLPPRSGLNGGKALLQKAWHLD